MVLVVFEPARGHTLLYVVIADPTRVDLVTRAAVVSQHAASGAERQKERHYRGRPRGDTFIPIAIEAYSALLSQTYAFLRDRAGEHFLTMADHPPLLLTSACARSSNSCAYGSS